jgi:glutamate racemase
MLIGFFDSGLGGLLVLKAVARELPEYDYLYYGDTANLPYGDKTAAEIYELTQAAIEILFERGCALVIVACNTASVEAIRMIQDTYLKEHHPERRILGVVVPTVEIVVESDRSRALLLATTRTVESAKYEKELRKLSNDSVELISIATPELVPLIEAGRIDEAVEIAAAVIEGQAREGDVVILGCTHYSLLKDPLRKRFAASHTFVSQDEVIPYKLKDYLERHTEIATKMSNTGKREVVLTEHRFDYDRIIADFLNGAYLRE